MSIEDHVIESLPAYALGALDVDEAEQVQEHLLVCASCQDELRAIEEITNDLPLALTEVDPPPTLWQELLVRVTLPEEQIERSTDQNFWQKITAMFQQNKAIAYSQLALLAIVLVLLVTTLVLWQRVNELNMYREPGHLQAIPLSSTGLVPEAEGFITVSFDGLSGAIILDRVPQLEEDQRYQLWLVKGDERTSGALLAVDELGYGGGRVRAPESLFNYSMAEVTIEPEEGSPQPTTDVVLSAPLFPQ